jgi:hypothetical protein
MRPYKRFTQWGNKVVDDVVLPSIEWIQDKFEGIPSDDIAWAFAGNVEVQLGGSYTFCSKSDDGSQLRLDGDKIYEETGSGNNHCVTVNLDKGTFPAQVLGFSGGGAYQYLTYSGPDTQDSDMPG